MQENKTVTVEEKKNSSLPLIIIGAVLLAAIAGGWWLFNRNTQTATANRNAAANSNTAPKDWNDVFAKASPGANPAWFKGSANAPVVVEEFADFQCPTCASMHPKVQELQAAFGNRVKIIFRQFPLEGHQWSYAAASATEAAGLQGKFWEMQNLIFTNQQTWSASPDARKIFTDYAKTLGLDVQRFSDDFDGMAVQNRINADLTRGRTVSVRSTPAFYINNQPLGANLSSLRQVVEAELQKTERK